MADTIYGIDLGTTYCSVSYCQPDGTVNVCKFDDGTGSGEKTEYVPSVVLFVEPKKIMVGQKAFDNYYDSENQVLVQYAKRDVGKIDTRTNSCQTWFYDNHNFTPQEIQAFILRYLKEQIDNSRIYPNLKKAVISHPQYFSDPQKKATIQSAELAGIEVVCTITEPAAAAISYGIGNKIEAENKSLRTLIFDLGGGTFDIVIQKVLGPQKIKHITGDGSPTLGGCDFDDAVFRFLKEEIEKRALKKVDFDIDASPVEYNEIRKHAISIKEKLSENKGTRLQINFRQWALSVRVHRNDLKEWCSNTLSLIESICIETLENIGMKPEDIDDVLLVGGSTKMPIIRELVEKIFGKPPLDHEDARTVVSKGAALRGFWIATGQAKRSDLGDFPEETGIIINFPPDVETCLPRGLGVKGFNPRSGQHQIDILIPKNTSLPTRFSKTFPVQDPLSPQIRIGIYEGESKFPDECTKIGEVVMKVPPKSGDGDREVKVVLDIDESTNLVVKAIDKETNTEQLVKLEHKAIFNNDDASELKSFLDQYEIIDKDEFDDESYG